MVPEEGFLFFSVWGNTTSAQPGYIERANMDGQKHKRIVSQDLCVQQPSSLTSDVIHKKIYWTDMYMASVGVSDYDGRQLKIILSYSMLSPLGLGLYEDYLYISNIDTDTLTRVSKFDGRSRTVFHRGNVKSEVIKVVHRVVQMIGKLEQIHNRKLMMFLSDFITDENPCTNKSCHMCLLRPGNHFCSCNKGYELSTNDTCVPSTSTPGSDNNDVESTKEQTQFKPDYTFGVVIATLSIVFLLIVVIIVAQLVCGLSARLKNSSNPILSSLSDVGSSVSSLFGKR